MTPIFGPSCTTRVRYTADIVKWRKDELKQWTDALETDVNGLYVPRRKEAEDWPTFKIP